MAGFDGLEGLAEERHLSYEEASWQCARRGGAACSDPGRRRSIAAYRLLYSCAAPLPVTLCLMRHTHSAGYSPPGQAVRVQIHYVRVGREHGGRLRTRMSWARGAGAARAALQRVRAAPRDGRPGDARRRCPTGHGIGAQPVCATHFIPAHHQGLSGHLRLKLCTCLSGLLVLGSHGERCSQRTCVLSSVGHNVA